MVSKYLSHDLYFSLKQKTEKKMFYDHKKKKYQVHEKTIAEKILTTI